MASEPPGRGRQMVLRGRGRQCEVLDALLAEVGAGTRNAGAGQGLRGCERARRGRTLVAWAISPHFPDVDHPAEPAPP